MVEQEQKEEESSLRKEVLDVGLKILLAPIYISTIIAALALGPIDATRTAYNALTGDMPILKKQLLDYSRRGLEREERFNIYCSLQKEDTINVKSKDIDEEIERRLASELGYDLLKGEKIDPTKVPTGRLWDATEKHPRRNIERFVWPLLKR